MAEAILKYLQAGVNGGYDLETIIYEFEYDNSDYYIITSWLEDNGIVSNNPNGYWITDKGRSLNSIYDYIENIEDGINIDSISKKKVLFDWKNRWFSHPLIVSIFSSILGFVVGYFIS